MKSKNSAVLMSSWDLENEIKQLNVNPDLMNEINKYIANNNPSCTGKSYSFSNFGYRCNLHYILDNIDNPKLIDELKLLNVDIN